MTDLGPRLTSTPKLNKDESTTMKHYLTVFTTLAVSLMSSTFIPSLKAGDVHKQTTITISEPISVEGTILPAGKYVLRLQDPSSSRDLISIFNGHGTRLITTVLALNAYRLEPTNKSEFKFYESPAGQPTALHTWFYPGDDSGYEFRQPKHTAAPASVEAGE
jgi:hypothetical protein